MLKTDALLWKLLDIQARAAGHAQYACCEPSVYVTTARGN